MCYVSTLAYVGSENIPFSTKTSLILLMSATFFCKKFVFLAKIIPLLKAIVWMLFWRFFISVFIFCKRLFLKNVSFLNHASGIRLPDGCKLAISKKKGNDVTILRNGVLVKLWRCCRVSHVISLVTGSSFMLILWLVLGLFIKDWSETRKSEIPPSKFFPKSGDWDKLGKTILARISVIKRYWTLQNARVTAFTVSELLRENQQGKGKITYPTQLLLKRQ